MEITTISMQNSDSLEVKTIISAPDRIWAATSDDSNSLHKITQLGCTLCGAMIGEHGVVKGAKLNGQKTSLALCVEHANTPITKLMTEK